MNRNKLRVAFFLLLLSPCLVDADIGSSFTVIGTGAPAGEPSGTIDGTTKIYDISKAGFIRVHVFCPVGPCVGTINVLERSIPTAGGSTPPMQIMISCTNPDSAGLCSNGATGYLNVPIGMRLAVQQTGTGSGTFAAILETHIIGK